MSERRQLLSRTSKINLTLLCIGFLAALSIFIMESLTSIVGMVAAALILTYLLLGPVQCIEGVLKRLKRLKQKERPLFSPNLSRTLSILLVYLMLAGFLVLALVRVAPPLSTQIKDFAHDIPAYLSRLDDTTKAKTQTPAVSIPPSTQTEQPKALPSKRLGQSRILAATARLSMQKLVDIYERYASRLGGYLLDIGTTTITSLVYLLTTLVLVFILLHDGRNLKTGFVDLMPSTSENTISDFLERLHLQFYSFIKAQVIISVLSGGLMYLLLSLLNVKYALMLGMLFGTASILPVIGPWIGLVPITLFVEFGNHPTYIIQILLYAGIFYLMKTYWLWPKLIDRRFDIDPIIFIITLIACMQIVGLLAGILLAFPLSSVLSVLMDTLEEGKQKQEASA